MKTGIISGKRLIVVALMLWCLLLGAGSVSAEEVWSPYPVSSPVDVITQLRNNNGLVISKEIQDNDHYLDKIDIWRNITLPERGYVLSTVIVKGRSAQFFMSYPGNQDLKLKTSFSPDLFSDRLIYYHAVDAGTYLGDWYYVDGGTGSSYKMYLYFLPASKGISYTTNYSADKTYATLTLSSPEQSYVTYEYCEGYSDPQADDLSNWTKVEGRTLTLKNSGKYTIRAEWKDGAKGWSDMPMTRTVDLSGISAAPGTSSSISAKLTAATKAKITWKKVTGATTYQVYRKEGSGAFKVLKKGVKTTSFTDKTLKAGKKYTYKIAAVNQNGAVGKAGKTASVTAPATVKGVKVTKKSAASVTVKWSKAAGASGYQISRSTSKTKNGTLTTISGTSATSKVLKLTRGKKYYYKVRAFQKVGSSKIYGAWSSVASFKLPAAKSTSTRSSSQTQSSGSSSGTGSSQSGGTQKALWFMDYVKISQVPGGNYSHAGTLNFDVVGYKGNSNIKAPFDCSIVKIYKKINEGNTVVIQSDRKVQYADGTVDYMSMAFGHDNDVSDLKVGMHLSQGQVFYQTGNYGKGVTGVHSHVTCIKGKFKNNLWAKKSKQGNSYCPNQINPVNALFLGNAKVINAKGLKFKK